MTKHSIQHLSDEQLLDDLQTTATLERGATAQLIALLAEMDARQLYSAQGYSSLFFVLHSLLAFVRARGIWTHRGCSCDPEISGHPRLADRRVSHVDVGLPSNQFPDPQ